MTTTNRVRSPWLVLATCCLSLFLVSLDVTIVNIALPRIRTDLHCSLSGLQWVIDAYTLVLASVLLFAGSLGDRFGRRRVFGVGLVVFTSASLACGLAPSLGWLIAFRVVQALGGSMLNPVAMSIIVNTFRDPAERARAIGAWAAVVGVSMALGPVLGGLLVEVAGWRSVFWVNAPVGVVAFVLSRRVMPESRADRPRRFDPAGQLLVTGALGTLTYAIIEAPHRGWASQETLTLFVVSGLCLAGLLLVERRVVEPLIELRFFRSVPFSAATVTAVAAFAGLGTFLFVNTLYLQEERGLGPVAAGAYTLPMAVLAGICAPLSGRLVAARGTRLPLVVSGIATFAGAVLLVPITRDTAALQLFAAYALIGVGFGLVNAPITNTATSGMPREQAGVAAALASTSRQVGASLGVAVSGSIVVGRSAGGLQSALAEVWWLVAGCGAAVLALGILATTSWARRTAVRTDRAEGQGSGEQREPIGTGQRAGGVGAAAAVRGVQRSPDEAA